MSYRLINANALAAYFKQVNDMPCIYADLPNGLDGGYYDMAQSNAGNSRWHELFGTPERAARTLETVADSFFAWAWSDEPATISDVVCALTGKCDECVAKGLPGRGVSTKCGEVDYNALIDWLRGDA